MDADRIKQFLKRKEGPKLDFKQILNLNTESEKKELTKDVIAIANSRGGRGYILFGVEDKTKRVIGVDPSGFSEEQIQQIIHHRSDPPVPVRVDFAEYEGVTLAVITVFNSRHKPHQMLQTGAFYIRRGSTTDIARRSEIAGMMQENGLKSYETVPLATAAMDDLDKNLLHDYFKNLQVESENPDLVLMEALGFIAETGDCTYSPTIGAMLLFGKNPSIFLPHCYIKIVCRDRVSHITGNIFEMLKKSTDCIREIVNDSGYPFEAFEEALANAIMHRDYLDIGRGIHVEVKDNYIEISNPGALIAGNSVMKYMRDKNPHRRNPWLYQRLLIMDRQKRFLDAGTGMSRMKKAFSGRGNVKFINIGSSNLFKVILPL
jgi:ATP-dependent DNA helicase RecG